jgi:outer membrane protein OmpA-like peptidoglycan-associated protein
MTRVFFAKLFVLYLLLFSSSMALVAQPANLDPEQQPVGAAYKKAVSLHQHGLYEEALQQYRESLKEPKNSKGELAALIEKRIAMCEYGAKRKSDPEPVVVTKLGGEINAPGFSNINAFPINTERALYFTSPRSESGAAPKGGSMPNDRACVATRDGGGQSWKVKILNSSGSNRYHEGVMGISPDGKEVFIYRSSRDIFLANIPAGSIQGKVDYIPLSKRYKLDLNKNYHISSMAITKDSKTIYLCMNDYGENGGHGGYDIWKSTYNASTGAWSKLTNLGPTLNTEGDEVSVSVLPDGGTLFFSSNGQKRNTGKFDIYRAERSDTPEGWGNPINLGYPINTANNNIYYNPVPENPNHAYYASERPDQPGMFDICFVSYHGVIRSEEEKDRLRQEYLQAIEDAKKSLKPKEKLKPREEKLLAKKGYQNFPTDSVRVGMVVYLKAIQFANGKATLRVKAYKQLETLYRLMVYHPMLKIEIAGHTDNVGKKAANKKLSQERAQSVVNYLISKGIDASRLVAKGYGDARPIVSNKTKAGKALNRRVEFTVLSIGEVDNSE